MPTGFILTPADADDDTISNEAQEITNILTRAGFQLYLIQSPATELELFRALDNGPYDLGWVGAHAVAGGFGTAARTGRLAQRG